VKRPWKQSVRSVCGYAAQPRDETSKVEVAAPPRKKKNIEYCKKTRGSVNKEQRSRSSHSKSSTATSYSIPWGQETRLQERRRGFGSGCPRGQERKVRALF
ncbi:unnamed protein product, partial [Ectocarpus sp. 6 AP-2014]